MSGFLLYHQRSRPTGEVLASALDVPSGISPPQEAPGFLIRWGSRVSAGRAIADRTLNGVNALAAASDKLGTLACLREAGVRVPDWSEDPTELAFPFLGRRVHHARGTDVVLCMQKGDYLRRPRDYYVQYIPTVREFRVHVVCGEVIRVQGKFLDNRGEDVPWIRNFANGYRFRAPRKRLRSERKRMAIDAVRALGLDFGAVDLLIGDDGLTYVLEVNTAPACSPLTAAGYVAAFARELQIPEDDIEYDRLGILSSDADDGDTEDEVEGEDEHEVSFPSEEQVAELPDASAPWRILR